MTDSQPVNLDTTCTDTADKNLDKSSVKNTNKMLDKNAETLEYLSNDVISLYQILRKAAQYYFSISKC